VMVVEKTDNQSMAYWPCERHQYIHLGERIDLALQLLKWSSKFESFTFVGAIIMQISSISAPQGGLKPNCRDMMNSFAASL